MRAPFHIGCTIALAVIAATSACRSTATNSADPREEQVAGQMLDIDYDEDRVICKRQRVAGSHVPRMICKTESQIQAEREALERSAGPLRPMTGTLQRDPGADPHR